VNLSKVYNATSRVNYDISRICNTTSRVNNNMERGMSRIRNNMA
jgi:hypothetical protein